MKHSFGHMFRTLRLTLNNSYYSLHSEPNGNLKIVNCIYVKKKRKKKERFSRRKQHAYFEMPQGV